MSVKERLKLRMEDAEDLGAASLHVQDAILRVADMHHLPRLRRFALVLNRLCWEKAGRRAQLKPLERIRAGLHFDGVMSVQARGITRGRPNDFLVLLAVIFEPREAPAGTIRLEFAGGATVSLDVECVEGALIDIGKPWMTPNRPRHETGKF